MFTIKHHIQQCFICFIFVIEVLEGLQGLKGAQEGLKCLESTNFLSYKKKYPNNYFSGCKITKGHPYRIHHNLKILDEVDGAEDWEGCRENCNYMGEAHFDADYCTHFVFNVSFIPLFSIKIFFLLKASDSTCTLLGLNYTRLEEGPWISGAKSCPKFCKLSTFFLKFYE